MSTSYEEQIAAIEELHKKEVAARAAAIIEYEKKLRELTDKHEEALEDLGRAREEDIEEFIRDFDEQPDELAREITETFGFEYVE